MLFYYENKKGLEKIQQVKNLKKNSWIKVVSPSQEEIDLLESKLSLDKILIRDALDQSEIPRIEKENKNVYIFLRIPKENPDDDSTITISLILTKENIITISAKETGLYTFLENSKDLDLKDQESFLVKTLRYIFRNYNENVRKILKEVKKDKRNISKLKNKDILDLVFQEDVLNDYISSLYPMISMYHKILRLNILRLDSEEKEEIEDLIIDLNQTFDTCKSVKHTISNMRDYYSTTLSNKINDSITILTVFTVFLTIPAVISSIYGMNIPLPFQDSKMFFLAFFGIVIFLWTILMQFFKKMMR